MSEQVKKSTVVLTLFAAIIISLGGTITVLTKLTSYTKHTRIQGLLTEEDGFVQIEISRVLSIDVVNNTIDFGTCTAVPSGQVAQINSNMTEGEINATWTNCSGSTTGLPAKIRVINDGTLPANITVMTGLLGSDLLHTTDAHFSFKAVNGSNASGGCAPVNGTYSWTNFTAINTRYKVCDRLQNHWQFREVWFFANLTITSLSYTEGAQSANLTFYAIQPGT